MQSETINSDGSIGKKSGPTFSSLYSSLLEPVLLIDTDGLILEANNAFCSRFCKSGPECRGYNYYGLLLPEVAAQRLIMIQEVLRSRKTVTWDDEWEGRILRHTVYPSQSLEGEINHLLIIAQDITDIEKLLKNERIFSKSVIDAIPGSFYVLDTSGKLTVWNRYVRDQVFGKAESEMASIIGLECIHPDDKAMMAEKVEKIMKNGDELITEAKVMLRGGPQFKRFLMTGNRMIINGNTFLVGAGIDITERKVAEEEVEHQLRHLRSLREIDLAIRGTTDLYLSLQTILEFTLSELYVDAADFLLIDPYFNTLNYKAGCGFRTQNPERKALKIVSGSAWLNLFEHKELHLSDFAGTGNEFLLSSLMESEGFIEYYAIPLIVKGNLIGLFEVFQRKAPHLTPDGFDFLHTLGGLAAMAIEDYQSVRSLRSLNQELLHAYDATIEGWSHALDLRDEGTEGHSRRVAEMTMKLARAAQIPDCAMADIHHGALLHDIGKMGVPDTILFKHDQLTEEEWVLMRKHPLFAFELLSPIAYLRGAIDIPYCHHEKWDGSGYPRGLRGEQIPLAARLFAIVDVWDALQSDRPYRQPLPKAELIEHITSLSGTHFDPNVVELFLKMITRGELP